MIMIRPQEIPRVRHAQMLNVTCELFCELLACALQLSVFSATHLKCPYLKVNSC